MTTASTRRRGAIATILDHDALLNAARAVVTDQHPGAKPANLDHGPLPQMLIPVNRGEIAVINNEGVGDIATEDDTIHITFSYGYQFITVALTTDTIATAATTQTIDLADGIRTFGSRLDANHYTWHSRYDHHQ